MMTRGASKSPQNFNKGSIITASPAGDQFFEWFQEFHDFKVSASNRKAAPPKSAQQQPLRQTKTFNYGTTTTTFVAPVQPAGSALSNALKQRLGQTQQQQMHSKPASALNKS
jgi:hypothetical protein